jgi:hypothetical protein
VSSCFSDGLLLIVVESRFGFIRKQRHAPFIFPKALFVVLSKTNVRSRAEYLNKQKAV